MGIPYVESFGTTIDQPPLGFYIEALFFIIFGPSVNTGVTLVALFGLGSTVSVYLIGKELYGKSTGFFAAALLGFKLMAPCTFKELPHRCAMPFLQFDFVA